MTTEVDGDEVTALDTEAHALLIRRTRSAQWRESWVGWTTVGANILVPFAIFIAGWGLWEETRQTKRDAAVNQINLLNSQGLANAQQTLFSLWTRQDLSVLDAPLTRQFIDAFVARTITASDINPDEITTSIVSITSYFDRVEGCIRSKRCDEREVLDQVGHYGRDFQCLYAGQIDDLRQERMLGDLGILLADFAERAGGCGMSEGTGN